MATLFRALVMLAVLVGLPGAWIYYGPLPPEAQRAVDRFVAAAKETVGWDKPQPLALSDAKDGDAMAPPPAWQGGATALAPAAGELPTPLSTPSAALAPAVTEPTAPTLAEQVEPLLAQLRQHGVVEYALERWGASGNLYRFHCEMPLGAAGAITQQFEAVADDPQQSVAQVVAQVSQWQRTGM